LLRAFARFLPNGYVGETEMPNTDSQLALRENRHVSAFGLRPRVYVYVCCLYVHVASAF
jgi:hypothetical protein